MLGYLSTDGSTYMCAGCVLGLAVDHWPATLPGMVTADTGRECYFCGTVDGPTHEDGTPYSEPWCGACGGDGCASCQ